MAPHADQLQEDWRAQPGHRPAALLHRYALGADLTPAELAEIEEFLAGSRALTRRITVQSYQHGPEHYAQAAGYKSRNIKKWIAIGRAKSPPDPPPLDAPSGMPTWWTRCMRQRVPGRLLSWAASVSQTMPVQEVTQLNNGATTPAESPAASPAPSAPPPRPPSPVHHLGDASSYEAMLQRASAAELAAHDLYMEALTAKDFSEDLTERRKRAHTTAADQVRELLRDKSKILAGNDEYGRWSDFEDATSTKLAVLNQSLRNSPVRVATILGLSGDLFTRLVSTWNAELDAAFAHLQTTDYDTAYAPPPPLPFREPLTLSAA